APVMHRYANYESALSDSDSYEDPRLIDVVREKTRRYRDAVRRQPDVVRSLQVAENMFAFTYVTPAQKLNVLEMGGACGATCVEIGGLLADRIQRWAIVETPSMVTAARTIFSDPALSFHTELVSACDALQSRHLLTASGVLQYTPDPLDTLNVLAKLGF